MGPVRAGFPGHHLCVDSVGQGSHKQKGQRAGFPGHHLFGDSVGQGSHKQKGLRVEIPAYLYGLRLPGLYPKWPLIYVHLPHYIVMYLFIFKAL